MIAAWGLAEAAPQVLEGIRFAEASGNFELLEVTGRGTLDDPFVLVENVTGPGDVIIEINVRNLDFGSRIRTFHQVGFALRKVVINNTPVPYEFFNLELEPTIGRSSDYFDGLSFAQEATANRPFWSDRFALVEDIQEPRDVLRFSDGLLAPGDRAEFHVAITHTGPAPKFYLVQHSRQESASREAPAWRVAWQDDP